MPSIGTFQRITRPGDHLRADDWNAVTQQLRTLGNVGSAEHILSTSAGTFFVPAKRKLIQPDHVLVRNDTGDHLTAEHSVLALGEPLELPEDTPTIVHKSPVVFSGGTPQEDQDEGRFAVLYGPVSSGGFQLGVTSGMTWVRLKVEDANHEYAEIEDGESGRLISADSGSAFIFWKASSGSERWAIVRLSRKAT